jgi:hypothetical protein
MHELRPWTLISLLCIASACGGSGSTASDTKLPAEAPPDEASGDEPEAVEEEPAPPPDPCASGTCTKCGEAVCLSGFYCEEAVSACGWLPQCADSPSCECVSKVLSDCQCEERDGGVYVKCG